MLSPQWNNAREALSSVLMHQNSHASLVLASDMHSIASAPLGEFIQGRYVAGASA